MSGTQARGLEPGPCHWNNSRSVGLGFWGEVGISPEAPERPCGHSTLQIWEVGTTQGCQGVPGDSPSSSVPTGHRLGMLLWGAVGSEMPLPSVLTGCTGTRVLGRGERLKFQSGMTWAGLISSLNCYRQKGIFSFSLTIFFSRSHLLLLNTLKATSRRSLCGRSRPFSSCRSLCLVSGVDRLTN